MNITIGIHSHTVKTNIIESVDKTIIKIGQMIRVPKMPDNTNLNKQH